MNTEDINDGAVIQEPVNADAAAQEVKSEKDVIKVLNAVCEKFHAERSEFKQKLAEKDEEIKKLQFENTSREIFFNNGVPFSIFKHLNCSDEKSLNSALEEILRFTESRTAGNAVLQSAKPVGTNSVGISSMNKANEQLPSNIRKAMGLKQK